MRLFKIDLYKSGDNSAAGRLRTVLIRGALWLLPIAITVFVVKYALGLVDEYLGGPTAALFRWISPGWLLRIFPDGHIPGMSMILLLLVMFLLGVIVSWKFGRQGLRIVDIVLPRIPVIGGIYSGTKKIVDTFAESNRFQRAVWFELMPGTKVVGFVTHEFIEDTTGEKWLKLFYPLVPNPSAGMLVAKPERETVPLDMDAKDVFTMMVALGTTMPGHVRIFPGEPPAPPAVTE